MDACKNLYVEELKSLLDEMRELNKGSDEYRTLLERGKKIADIINEMEERENDRLKMENDLEVESIKQKLPKAKIALEMFKTVFPVVANGCLWVWGKKSSANFETNGIFTTNTAKSINQDGPRFKW